MAANVVIVPAAIAHVYLLAANMRAADRAEAVGLGADPKRALRLSFRQALMRRTAFVDGAIAAMWGLAGDCLSDVGYPWLVTSAAIERLPLTFVREGRRQLAAMLRLKPILENVVAADYAGAVRFLEILGFTLEEPIAMGPAGLPYRKFWIAA